MGSYLPRRTHGFVRLATVSVHTGAAATAATHRAAATASVHSAEATVTAVFNAAATAATKMNAMRDQGCLDAWIGEKG